MLYLKNVSIALDTKPIIDTLSLSFSAGTVHALMGPNGSGKSTLAATLMGHPAYTLTSGQLLLDTSDLSALPVEKRARAGLFLAAQYPQEVPGVQVFTFLKEAHRMLTGQDIAVSAFKELVYAAFDRVNLDHSFVYRNLHEGFSGGEKKRLEIAQLLLFSPKVALLDEIDSGLDVDALKLVAQALQYAKSVNPDLVLILITHYNRILEYIVPDYVHVISCGRLVASGSHELAHTIEQRGYNGLSL
ncbi:Fe-S cluster assembly ATPase SufC [Candidatus Dependentiae bacterium]|nr:Fe-S cluster assembly ATPase SufC [Candidatus Dependentiae bacterium]